MADQNLKISITTESKQVTELKKELSGLSAEMKKWEDILKQGGLGAAEAEKQLAKLGKQFEKKDAGLLAIQLKELAQETKAVELSFKSNNITTEQAAKRFQDIAQRIKDTGASELQLVDITQRLWHANNRVEIGFKSLATETINANRQLRAINQEQRIGNQLLGSLGSLLGGPAAGVIGSFQQFEGVLQTGSVALRNFGGVASMLSAAAGPLAIMGGIIAFTTSHISGLRDEIKKLDKQIYDSLVRQGKISKEEQYKKLQADLKAAEGETFSPSFTTGAAALLSGRGGGAVLAVAEKEFNKQKQLRIELLNEEIKKLKESVKIQLEEVEVVGKLKTARKEAESSFIDIGHLNEAQSDSRLNRITSDRRRVGGRGFGGVNAQYQNELSQRRRAAAASGPSIAEVGTTARSMFAQIGADSINLIGNNLVKAFVMGEEAAFSFGNIARSILASVLSGLIGLITGGIFSGGGGGGIGGFSSTSQGRTSVGGGGGIGGFVTARTSSRPITLSGGFELKYDRLAFKLRQGERVLDSRSI